MDIFSCNQASLLCALLVLLQEVAGACDPADVAHHVDGGTGGQDDITSPAAHGPERSATLASVKMVG